MSFQFCIEFGGKFEYQVKATPVREGKKMQLVKLILTSFTILSSKLAYMLHSWFVVFIEKSGESDFLYPFSKGIIWSTHSGYGFLYMGLSIGFN